LPKWLKAGISPFTQLLPQYSSAPTARGGGKKISTWLKLHQLPWVNKIIRSTSAIWRTKAYVYWSITSRNVTINQTRWQLK
jgi:hypothetical protein